MTRMRWAYWTLPKVSRAFKLLLSFLLIWAHCLNECSSGCIGYLLHGLVELAASPL